MAKGCTVTNHNDGFEFWYEYNERNLRITSVEWTVPANVFARFVLYDTDESTTVPQIDTLITQDGSVNPTGQWRMEEQLIDGEMQLALPLNILFDIRIQSPAAG